MYMFGITTYLLFRLHYIQALAEETLDVEERQIIAFGDLHGRSDGLGLISIPLKANLSWPEALQSCRENLDGGSLIEIISSEQLQILTRYISIFKQDYLKKLFSGFNVAFWIGLNDIETRDEFAWPIHGPANYTHWAPGFPLSSQEISGNSSCALMLLVDDLPWYNIDCNLRQEYQYEIFLPMCQAPLGDVPEAKWSQSSIYYTEVFGENVETSEEDVWLPW